LLVKCWKIGDTTDIHLAIRIPGPAVPEFLLCRISLLGWFSEACYCSWRDLQSLTFIFITVIQILLCLTLCCSHYFHIITTPRDVQGNTRMFPNVLGVFLPCGPSICFKVVTFNHSCKKRRVK